MLSVLIHTSLAFAAVCYESIEPSVIIDVKNRAQQSFQDHVDQLNLSLRLDNPVKVTRLTIPPSNSRHRQ